MTKQNQVYKCEICGNITEVLHTGVGELVCCGQPMNLQEEKKQEEGNEKHLPYVVKNEDGSLVIRIGETEHPMEEKHYIEWIEINMKDGGRITKKYFKAGDKPEVEFHTRGEHFEIRAYCNVHGLWKLEI